MHRLGTVLTLTATLLWLGTASAVAGFVEPDDPFHDDGFGAETAIPGWFVGFFVLILLIGIGGTIWRVTLARQIARENGQDPDRATTVELLSQNGLETTYLASSIRQRQQSPAAEPAAEERSATDRLAELTSLRDRGLVTDDEFQRRRTAIIDSI